MTTAREDEPPRDPAHEAALAWADACAEAERIGVALPPACKLALLVTINDQYRMTTARGRF